MEQARVLVQILEELRQQNAMLQSTMIGSGNRAGKRMRRLRDSDRSS